MKKHTLEYETKYELGHKLYKLHGYKILTYILEEIRVVYQIVDESDRRHEQGVRVSYHYRVNDESKNFEYETYYSFGDIFSKDYDREEYTENPEELIQLLVDTVRKSLEVKNDSNT